MEKGCFVLNYKRTKVPTDTTMYDCFDCAKNGVEHKIEDKKGPPGQGNEVSTRGCSTTIRVCTGCGKYDGPWVSAPW